MNLLSSQMANVFHYTVQLPIQSLHCQFDLPVAQLAWHIHIFCFCPTCSLLASLFFYHIYGVCSHCGAALGALAYFSENNKLCPSPVKSSSFLIFQSSWSTLVLLSRLLFKLVSVMSLLPLTFFSLTFFKLHEIAFFSFWIHLKSCLWKLSKLSLAVSFYCVLSEASCPYLNCEVCGFSSERQTSAHISVDVYLFFKVMHSRDVFLQSWGLC